MLSIVIPAHIYVGSVFLTPSRIFLLIITPYLAFSFLQGKYGKFTLNDLLVVLIIIWMSITTFIHHFDIALQFVSSNILMIFGGYLVGRATIRTIEDVENFVKFLGLIIICFIPFAIYEAITTQFIIPKIIQNIPGVSSVTDVNYRKRLGFDRAQVVFAHPIHFGIYCSLGAGIFFMACKGSLRTWSRWLGSCLILLATLLSLSSGPLLSALVQMILIMYHSITEKFKKQWIVLGVLGILGYIIVEIISTRPAIYAIASRLSFSSHTASVRLILFDYGSAQVAKTPFLGLGYKKFDMPEYMSGSVDNHWLLLALTHGLPLLFLWAILFINTIFIIKNEKCARYSQFYYAKQGYSILFLSIAITMGTVALWTEIFTFIFYLLGASWYFQYGQPSARGLEEHDSENVDISEPAKPRAAVGDISNAERRTQKKLGD